MKVQYAYLKGYLSTDLSQAKLSDVFTEVGFECEVDGAMIDFDITPNRGDALSLRGLQREFDAHQSRTAKREIPVTKLKFLKDKTVIDKVDQTGCGNYHLAMIKNIESLKNLDSKKQKFLLEAGVPLIHPLVDLGNYVMLELGTPMHIFDLDSLQLPINVLFKSENKTFQAIGGDYKNLEASTLTIQDQKGVQAIAGIIGGEKTAVSKKTTNIAIEAAFFIPHKIVNQARKYGLATDASHRFERGVDPEMQKTALARFIFLLKEIAHFDAIQCFEGESTTLKPKYINLNVQRFNNFSGLTLTSKRIKMLLENLNFDLAAAKKDNLKFKVPSHRFDIDLEEDLYEEILRCYGYDNIPVNSSKSGPIISNREFSNVAQLRSGLVFGGFQELIHIPFVSKKTFDSLNIHSRKPAELLNPINENEPMMRGSLFGSLFNAIYINAKKNYSTIKVFEEGNVFYKNENEFSQESHLSGIIYDHGGLQSWSAKTPIYDFYSLKADVLQLLKTIAVSKLKLIPTTSSKIFNSNSMDIFAGKKKIGIFGEIDLTVTQKMIKNTVFGFELYPEEINSNDTRVQLKPSSKFPSASRDINILISKEIKYSLIKSLLEKGRIKFLKQFILANTFDGAGIPDESISMTLRFIFQSPTKSLTESDINLSMNKAFQILQKSFKAEIRS